jgi:hypothetical protein
MRDYVFLFRHSNEASTEAMGSPERAQQSMEAWLAWIRDMEAKGQLRNPGQPLDRSGSIVRKDAVTDGPYVEAKDLVLGFIVVQARDLAEASEIAKGCPIVAGGGSVEVRPVDLAIMGEHGLRLAEEAAL